MVEFVGGGPVVRDVCSETYKGCEVEQSLRM